MSNETENESMRYCATINPEDPMEKLRASWEGRFIEVEFNIFPSVSIDNDEERDVRRCWAAMAFARNVWGSKVIGSFWKFHWREDYRTWSKMYHVEYINNEWPEWFEDCIKTQCYFPEWLYREYYNCVLIYQHDECDYKCGDQYDVCCEVSQEQCITK